MALPQPEQQWSNPAEPAGATTDWDSLRHDLESLLQQVENRHLQPGLDMPQTQQEDHASPDARHRAALRAVQKAVARFSEPAHAYTPPRHSDLEDAISEIRARTGGPVPHQQSARPNTAYMPDRHLPEDLRADLQAAGANIPRHPLPHPLRPAPEMHAPSSEAVSGLNQLTNAVSGMAGRLERLEADMRVTRDASSDITDIAAQVGQLTQVVELVSGAVGEQGQVKRLESQIADLARLYAEGSKPEFSALANLIDELGITVDRLAEYQVREIGRLSREDTAAASGAGDAMKAIEEGVRNIYDRFDALETSYAVAPEDMDRLTREMAGVTRALNQSDSKDSLASIGERLETLSSQIDGLGRVVGNATVSSLSNDVKALRDVVSDAIEPRFTALETRLESLSGRIDSAASPPDFSRVEDQIRRLAEHMDQTGQQLAGLTALYKSESDRTQAPDYETLAALVAERTSQEIARVQGTEAGLDETGLDALENRLSKLFTGNRAEETPGVLADVAENLSRVDARLDRLEGALESLSVKGTPVAQNVKAPAEPNPIAPPQPIPFATPQPAPAMSSETVIAQNMPEPAISEPAPRQTTARAPQLPDDMPHAPSREEPLVDNELSTLAAPVEDWSSMGFDEPAPEREEPAAQPPGLPAFDASKIERPARPKSSFADEPSGFTPMEELASDGIDTQAPEDDAPVSDRNTFIAAARRAARGNLETQQATDASQSLIGRALARFQLGKSAEDTSEAKPAKKQAQETPAMPVADVPEPLDLPEGKATLDDFAPDHADRPGANDNKPVSFLVTHRRALVLAGALVVTILLAVNLVVQRQTAPNASIETSSADTTSAIDALIDPIPTGSINPAIEMSLTEPSPPTRQILPSTLTSSALPGTSALDPTFTHSVPPTEKINPIEPEPAPIKLELPPEELGPLALRQAAADGDPRAQFEIGAIYTEGSVVTQDFKTAATWYERAAAKGFVPAQYRLGNLYEHGNGIDKDLEQARLWYARAAEAGNRLAMHNLASLYASGDLGEQQFAAAAEWFERASESGMTDSQFNLGMLYARGLGITQDLTASYKWFSLAAEQGDKDAAKARNDIAKSLDDAALAKAKADIAAWHMAPINISANFAPIGTWSDTFDPGQTITEKKVTEGVQRALARLGYDPGTIDGVMGPKTTQAITEFERATGMTPTGLVNPRLLAVLGSQPV